MGTQGTGAFFYEYWQRSIPSDDVFDIDYNATAPDEKNGNFIFEKFKDNADEIMKQTGTNGFLQVYYHWSEDPRKDSDWYEEQKKQQNYNSRKIAQEYDIRFVGSSDNPFEDEILEKLQKAVLSPINHLNLPHSTRLKIYKDIDPTDYYLIGVDTASSMDNCYSAIEVYSFKDFEQIGELAIRLGSLSQYSDIVMAAANYFADKTGGRILLCIENNSIGKAIVEAVAESNLVYYMFHEKEKVDQHGIVTEWGINTNGRTKPIMVAECYSHINEHPQTFHSQELTDQLNSLERNNAGQVTSKAYTENIFV